jgi:hypothetical protein
MPLIRAEILTFIRLWNVHTIRKLASRPNGVFGKPFFLYHFPEDRNAQDYGYISDETLLDGLISEFEDWGMISICLLKI